MLKVQSFTSKGVRSTDVILPKEWEVKSNGALLAQAIRVYDDRGHFGLAKTKTRAEVNRTTKKLYKQKGTGGARHGSRKAPIFVGGGVAHGPRPVSRELTLPTKMRRKALGVAMTSAVKQKRVVAAQVDFKKTSEAQKFIEKTFGGKDVRVTFILKRENYKIAKSIRNIENAKVLIFPSINAFNIFFGGNIVIDKSIFAKEVKEISK